MQFSFLVCNAFGVAVGVVYNSKTPDLYENNAHHRLGWVGTCVVVAQMLLGMLTAYAGRGKGRIARREEHEPLVSVSSGAMSQAGGYRYSNDSGQGTERASSSFRSESLASLDEANGQRSIDSRRQLYDVEDNEPKSGLVEKPESLHNSKLDRFLSRGVSGLLSDRVLRLIDLTNNGLDRVILVLGFVAMVTGLVTYYGLFVSHLSRFQLVLGILTVSSAGIIFSAALHTVSRVVSFSGMGYSLSVVGWAVLPSSVGLGT